MPSYSENPGAGMVSWDDYLASLSDYPWWQLSDVDAPVEQQANPFDNPYWGPLNEPANVTIGDPSMQIFGASDPSVIGAFGQDGANIYDVGQYDVFDPSHGSLGANNPTNYGGGGGLLGSGIDVGLPGIASVGGIMQTVGLGGLVGMGGAGSGLGGAVGVDTGGSGGWLGVGDGGGTLGLGGGVALGAGLGLGGPGSGATVGVGTGTTTTDPVVTETDPVVAPIITTPEEEVKNPVAEKKDPVIVPPIITPPKEEEKDPVVVSPIITDPISNSKEKGKTTTPIVFTPTTRDPVTDPVVEEKDPVVVPPIITPPATTTTPATSTTSTTTMPTPINPLDRNYYREGNQTTQDYNLLGPGIFNNYANYSGQYGGADLANFGALLSGVGGYNNQLTGLANQQTIASNTALRTGNVNDAGALGGQALGTLQRLNPNMYGALNAANATAGRAGAYSPIQQLLQQQALGDLSLGGQLSPEDTRRAQQAAREAWSARGLVNSNGAVADEVLNQDYLARQREAERRGFAQSVDAMGFGQRQQGFSNTLQNAALQGQYAFNPFQTITSATTQNQGLNQNLFGNTAGFSSGSFGNQNVQQLVNPFNPYAADVYDSNFNAANDRYIAAGNNAVGLQAQQDRNTGNWANMLLNFAGQQGWFGACYVAREVYGADNPRWVLFRSWLMNRAPTWFREIYLEHGREFAGFIADKPGVKDLIRQWMDARLVEYVNGQPVNMQEAA